MTEPQVHHVHKYVDRRGFGDLFSSNSGLNTIFCYQEDCYGGDVSRIDRDVFPPEILGPKLIVLPDPEVERWRSH